MLFLLTDVAEEAGEYATLSDTNLQRFIYLI